MKRREALVSLVVSGAVAALPACSSPAPATGLSEAQLRAMLRLNGLELRPGESSAVLASFNGSRFTTAVDPGIQPTDFDADVDA